MESAGFVHLKLRLVGVTIHLVYPHGDRISAPDTIGRHVADGLRGHGHEVITHGFTERGPLTPLEGDVLLGHPSPDSQQCFNASLADPRWARIVAMSPFHNGDLGHTAFLARILPQCHRYLAITGSYWFSTIPDSVFAPFLPRIEHLDLELDPVDFPRRKSAFAPPGRRRFLYIGALAPWKNPRLLERLAADNPEMEFAWLGGGGILRDFRALGQFDFRDGAAQALVADHDFLITVGGADANPTTVLEAMAWGLVPVCTRESGYDREPGIVNVPLADTAAASAVLRRLQQMPEAELLTLRALNDQRLATHFTWKRFIDQVQRAVTDRSPPPKIGRPGAVDRLHLAWHGHSGHLSPHRAVRFLHRLHHRLAYRILPRWSKRVRK